MKKNQTLPTEAQIEKFLTLNNMIEAIYSEMKEFSKKKPDDHLNKFKVQNVNRVLEQVKEILKNEPTAMFVDILDDDTLPSNSDAILVIGQFKASMERFRDKYTDGWGNWKTKEYPDGKRP